MPVITINGEYGSGAPEVGVEVARTLGMDYVDRLVLAEASRRIRVPVAALAQREERSPTLGERAARLLQRVLERSALAGGDPYFGASMDALLLQPYPEGTHEPAQEMDDRRFVEAISQAIRTLAQSDNIVVVGRASNLVLQDHPRALHIGLVAPYERRLAVIMEREHLDRPRAERHIAQVERARDVYYRRFFKTDPSTPHQYHLVLNTGLLTFHQAADFIVHLARLYWPPATP
ncbi:MAG: cytidylate kinase-like family protein [Dehalococcoidia bacterium]|nr:cytidylate kinase-like family protein [Dehalococcoidia bacterium]MDW8120362.1 cytidylate kinase-like family protein [Chloroflexota bacterium]